MKVPPRSMFSCQVVATIIAGTVQLGVQAWLFSNIEDLCSPDQKDGFICPSTTVFGTASIIVCYIVLSAFVSVANATVSIIVGCHWPATSVFAWPDVLWPRVLLPDWGNSSACPVGTAQELQDCIPEICQFPDLFHRLGYHATSNANKLRALGPHLLRIQLYHSSSPLRLVVQVQLCVY